MGKSINPMGAWPRGVNHDHVIEAGWRLDIFTRRATLGVAAVGQEHVVYSGID